MQKKSLIFFLLIGFIGLVLSCKEMTSDVNAPIADVKASSVRLDFLKGKNLDEIKAYYQGLSEAKRLELWFDKFAQIKTQRLSSNVVNLINALEVELRKPNAVFSFQNQTLKSISIELASSMPREDFLRMFVFLDDYKTSSANSSREVCHECISDLEKEDGRISNSLNLRVNCNCQWTCSLGGGCGSSKCSPTSSGCGFLWLSSCGYKATMDC